METKDIIALGALALAIYNYILAKNNSDRFGVKKIVFDKKLKIYLDIIDKLNTNFTVYAAGNGLMVAINFRVPIDNVTKAALENHLKMPLYIESTLIQQFLQDLRVLREPKLVDREIYDALNFVHWSAVIHKKSDLSENRAVIYSTNHEEELMHLNNLATLGEFITALENALETIYLWIDTKSSMKGVLRK